MPPTAVRRRAVEPSRDPAPAADLPALMVGRLPVPRGTGPGHRVPFQLVVNRRDRVATVTIRGELDLLVAPIIHEGLEMGLSGRRSAAPVERAVFDMASVTHIGSASLRVLAAAAEGIVARGGAVELCPSMIVLRLVRGSAFARVFEPDARDAHTSPRPRR